MPAFFKTTNYRGPRDVSKGPFQYAFNIKLPFWVWMKDHPKVTQRFHNYMSGYRQGKASWMDPGFYPVKERLSRDLVDEKDAVLLVDVGGGLGHDLEEFKSKHPHLRGRLILQDLLDVVRRVERTERNEGIEIMGHNFFQPQVIRGKCQCSSRYILIVLMT